LKRRWDTFSIQRVTGVAAASHQETLDRILATPAPDRTPKELFGGTSDDFWLWCFTDGYREDERLRTLLPGFAPEEIQYQFAGAAGDDTMRDAFAFYCLVKSLVAQHAVRPPESILEFGCGWGRIIRFFLKDVQPDRLWGIDCMPEAIALCTSTNRHSHFELVNPFPPTSVPDSSFDLVYSYSVFSHLSEDAHLAWLGEFKRILKAGGLAIATTRPRDFILTCAEARAAKEERDWAQGTVLAFRDTEDALRRYDRGEYLYEGLGAGGVLDASFFGETCIPQQYVVEHWTKLFEFIGYIDDRRLCLQNVVVVRKTA
jgi:SAM-dependent methyltransferase